MMVDLSRAQRYKALSDEELEKALETLDHMAKVDRDQAAGGILARLEKDINFEMSEIRTLAENLPKDTVEFLFHNLDNIKKALDKERARLRNQKEISDTHGEDKPDYAVRSTFLGSKMALYCYRQSNGFIFKCYYQHLDLEIILTNAQLASGGYNLSEQLGSDYSLKFLDEVGRLVKECWGNLKSETTILTSITPNPHE